MTYKYARTAETLAPEYREVLKQRIELRAPLNDNGCRIWTGTVSGGYGNMTVSGLLGCGQVKAHVLAWLLWRGDVPARRDVAHRCNNKLCVNPLHLYIATRSQNHRDARRDGLQRGKLTRKDVEEIKAASGLQREIAARFGIAQQTVSCIRSGRSFLYFD